MHALHNEFHSTCRLSPRKKLMSWILFWGTKRRFLKISLHERILHNSSRQTDACAKGSLFRQETRVTWYYHARLTGGTSSSWWCDRLVYYHTLFLKTCAMDDWIRFVYSCERPIFYFHRIENILAPSVLWVPGTWLIWEPWSKPPSGPLACVHIVFLFLGTSVDVHAYHAMMENHFLSRAWWLMYPIFSPDIEGCN